MRYNKMMHKEYLGARDNLEKRGIRFNEKMQDFEVDPIVLADKKVKRKIEKSSREYLKSKGIKTPQLVFNLNDASFNNHYSAVTFIPTGSYLVGVHKVKLSTPENIMKYDIPSTFNLVFYDDGRIIYEKSFNENIYGHSYYVSFLNLRDNVYSLKIAREDRKTSLLVRSPLGITTSIDNMTVMVKKDGTKKCKTKGGDNKFGYELEAETNEDNIITSLKLQLILKGVVYDIQIFNNNLSMGITRYDTYRDIINNKEELKQLYDAFSLALEKIEKGRKSDYSIFLLRKLIFAIFELVVHKQSITESPITLPLIDELQKEVLEDASHVKNTMPLNRMQDVITDTTRILNKKKGAPIIIEPLSNDEK